jgi:AcrR family transcriptional regulator
VTTSSEVVDSKNQVGRPRNTEFDGVILQTVRDVLAEVGYQGLSVQEITRRCGVHVRTVARRWPTKAELVATAIFGGELLYLNEMPELPSGDLRADLRELVRRTMRFLVDPATRAALPALWSEIHNDEGVFTLLQHRHDEMRSLVHSVLKSAVDSGDAPQQILDRGNLLSNILTGTAMSLQVMTLERPSEAVIDQLADFAYDGLIAGHATSSEG